MKNLFKIKKDGKECKVKFKETKNGMKIETEGEDCKKIMGKEFFKEMEVEFD